MAINNKIFKGLKTCIRIVILTTLAISEFSHSDEQNINALRSAYLYYFSELITWPSGVPFPENKLYLCAASEDQDDIYQLSTIHNKVVGLHQLHIEFIKESTPTEIIKKCHILFIQHESKHLYSEYLSRTSNYLLAVTEGDFINKGDIHLFTQSKKLKFTINNKYLTKRGFRVSSKLLRVSQRKTP